MFELIIILSIMAIYLLVMVAVEHCMARENVIHPSEFLHPISRHSSKTDSILMAEDVLMTPGYGIARDTTETTKGTFSEDQELHFLGVAYLTTEVYGKYPDLEIDYNTPMGYIYEGKARWYGVAPITAEDELVCAADGRCRRFNALTDTRNMIRGTAECGITVTDDIVDVILTPRGGVNH